ncbi:MAG: hypothetical protein HOV80_22025 [Polyangiaceae bacterium]|nr:hypothetical protein [Polyangiaceae bacterium]
MAPNLGAPKEERRMWMKVAVSTSLIVGLTASVAHAQESGKPQPATNPQAGAKPQESKAQESKAHESKAQETFVEEGIPSCPPVQPAATPPPVMPTPVSYPEPAPRPMPAPVPYSDEGVKSYLDLAPRNAFEIGFQGGYFQPFGDLMKDTRISNITDAGGEVGLDLGWRIGPMGAIAVTGRYHESVVDDSFAANAQEDIRGGAVGFQGTVYFAPYLAANPYLTMGAAYRTLWLVPQTTDTNSSIYHGVELARVQFGVDFRVARDFSIGPNAGAAVNMFFAEDAPADVAFNPSGDTIIDDPRPSAMIFAGLAGRFEVGGTRESESTYYGKAPARTYTASAF